MFSTTIIVLVGLIAAALLAVLINNSKVRKI